jgi:hypothetical protein
MSFPRFIPDSQNLARGRVFCLNPAGGDGLPHELISRGALELALGEIARNPQRAARLFAKEHGGPPPPEWNAPENTRDNPAVRSELERIWLEAERLGWSWQRIFNCEFWAAERGLASVFDPGDHASKSGRITFCSKRPTLTTLASGFGETHDEPHFHQRPGRSATSSGGLQILRADEARRWFVRSEGASIPGRSLNGSRRKRRPPPLLMLRCTTGRLPSRRLRPGFLPALWRAAARVRLRRDYRGGRIEAGSQQSTPR